MGYMHIPNLYQRHGQDILLFKEAWALEKIHGTSSSVTINPMLETVKVFSGGVSHTPFEKLILDLITPKLVENKDSLPIGDEYTIYGEAYGGSCQKMSAVYGANLRFVAFDVKVGDVWLNVPNAHNVANKLGLEFVHYDLVRTDIELLNEVRDRPSVQARRNGMGDDKWREGIVLRPPQEFIKANGERVIAKHKREEYRETKKVREVTSEQLTVLSDAQEVANEWVVMQRLEHVLDKLPQPHDMTLMPKLIPAMLEDVKREGEGEIQWSKEVENAIKRKTTELMKAKLQKQLESANK